MELGVNLQDVKLIDIIESDEEQRLFSVRNLRYFVEPKADAYPLKLYDGFQEYIFRQTTIPPLLNKTLYFLMSERGMQLYPKVDTSNSNGENKNTRVQIFSKHSALQFIMKLALPQIERENQNNFNLIVSKFNGKLFLNRQGVCEKRVSVPRDTTRRKLEQYFFASTPGGMPKTDVPIDENCQTFGIVSAKLKQFDLCYTSEFSGIKSDVPIGDLNDPAELAKCHPVIMTLVPMYKKWRSDYRTTFWCNLMHLTCVKSIYVATANVDGLVRFKPECETCKSLAKYRPKEMQVDCFGFMHSILEQIDYLMRDVNCPYTTYSFSFNAEAQRLEHKVYAGQTEYSFLSKEYIDFMQQK